MKKMIEETLTYETAYAELAEIARQIEEETVSVDELAAKVQRASELISFCQSRLRTAESEVNKVIAQLDKR